LGGLSKKAFLIKSLINEQQLPALVITGGNLLFKMDRLEPGTAETAKIAADGVLQANQKMGVTFAGIGAQDLAAGLAFLRQSQKPPAFTWLSLNLVDPASRQPLFTPMLHRQVGNVKIAILAITDHTAFPNEPGDFQVADWRSALPEALAKMDKDVACILLLSNYSLSENMEIARKHSSIDLIFQAGHVIGNMTPTVVNKTLIAQTEIRGKYLGVMDIDWNGQGKWSEGATSPQVREKGQPVSTYANRFIALKQSLVSDPEIEALVRQTQRSIDKLHHGQTR
jgi:2',3'-cyclic-nucleotide 2'-phosphodiesterase (5'-nucleotidase family)